MFIDMHVHPAFYEPINQDSELEELSVQIQGKGIQHC